MSYEIRSISIQEIGDYISGDEWSDAHVMPITPERAFSQQLNPNARPDDICLWVATDKDGRVIGFAGSLPANDVHGSARMGWNSCWWVDPDRGNEVAMPLFYQFLKAWDQRVAFADMTDRTRAIIDQLGFCNTREEALVQVYLRVPASRIIARMGAPGKILYPLIFPLAFLVNGFQQTRLNRFSRRNDRLVFEIRDHLDRELCDFIRQHQGKDFAQRSCEEYRWIEQHPWLVTGSASSRSIGKKYPFSYQVKRYHLEWLVSRREGSITSVMLISIRDGALKVLYYFGKNPQDAAGILKMKLKNDRGVCSLIFAHPDLLLYTPEIRSAGLKTIFRSRQVGVSKKIMEEFPGDLVIQLGDGDSVFT